MSFNCEIQVYFREWHLSIEMHVGQLQLPWLAIGDNGSNQRTTSVPLINLHNCSGVTAIEMRYAANI